MIEPTSAAITAHLRLAGAHHRAALERAALVALEGRRNPTLDPSPVTPPEPPKGADDARRS